METVMLHRQPRQSLSALLATVIALTGLAVVQPSPAVGAVQDPLSVVLVGDSYSAGNGAGDYEPPTGCYRSSRNWAGRFVDARRKTGQTINYTNAACHGATTHTFFNDYSKTPYDPTGGKPNAGKAQAPQIKQNTDLLLFTFGGNDIGFSHIVKQCFIYNGTISGIDDCKKAIAKANQVLDDPGADGMHARFSNLISGMRGRVNVNGRIVMMGYPYLIASDCHVTQDGYDLTENILQLTDKANKLQYRIESESKQRPGAVVDFIPVSGRFYSHGPAPKFRPVGSACWHNPQTWIEEATTVTATAESTWYHPDPNGQQAYADALLAEYRTWMPTKPTKPANTPPVASFVWSRVTGAGNSVDLDARASRDPDVGGSIIKYEWLTGGSVVATGPTARVSFTGQTSPSLTLRVTDNLQAVATQVQALNLPNRAPVIGRPNPADGTIVGTNRPVLSTTVTDADGDDLTFDYRITGYMVDKSSGPQKGGWTVPASTLDPGTKYRWTVTVTDGRGGSASASRDLTVAMLPTAADVISTPSGKGYWQVASDGGVFSYGDAQFYGSVPGIPLRLTNIMGMARTPSGKGYWVVGSDGGVFSFGDAGFYGSLPGQNTRVNNVVDMVPTKTGRGYWLVASDGGVFSFGDAQFYGSMGGQPLNKPVVGMSATASGNGYWLVAGDGGIFSFGDAPFYGSMGGQPLSYPVVDMDATPDGGGYWMTAEDGGVFSFGNAQFYGSTGGKPLNGHVTGMAVTPTGKGYWLNACDGGIFTFGDAPFYGANPTYMCRGTNQP